jgi:uncharacterized protein GlcG (DUF336 family)
MESTDVRETNMMKTIAGILLVGAFLVAPSTARAQGASPMPLEKAVVSNEIAARTLFKYQLSSTLAQQLVQACIDFARAQTPMPGNYAIFVLAPNGDIIAAHVMDGVVPIGVETGMMKAKTALYARSTSRAVAERFSDVEGRLIRTDLGREQGLSYYFVGGGVPIVLQGQLIGSIGVGGGNMDEPCAYAALTKVLGIQPPPAAAPRGGGPGGGPGGGGPGVGAPAPGRGGRGGQ